ncbi:MAG: N-acetylmuramoyl-L-alanine amidase [Candidatus Fermentibacteraceae bacterium]|nr:N-acetylmuramoyl-L-alanine amidase [Candidatus Fermentibacteraceae bacterium]MBN2607473.1 N-acetylmuramoyl-L-alanine amidase [Candidatus Fermentibacteraceae bacterium]
MIRFSALLLLLTGSPVAWTVCLDPGHGGSDTGATGIYCTEKEANLDVAFMARSYLEQLDDCSEVAMTRLADQEVSLADRVAYANAGGYDRFISIHHNAFNGSVQGTETYCDSQGSPEDFALRDVTHPFLVNAFDYYDRGVKTAGFYVLKYTAMPAILGEASFLDYVTAWNESWRFNTRWMDHDGREGWAYCAGLCRDQSSPFTPDWQSRVVDNSYPDFSTHGPGPWSSGSFGSPFGPDYSWLTVAAETDSAQWKPYMPLSGWYQVSLWWVGGSNRVTSARVTVRHDQGEEVFTVDQTQGGEEWYSLGVFPFHEGSFGCVIMSTSGCQPGRVMVADAVRFMVSPTGIGEAPGSRTGPSLLVSPNPAVSSVIISPLGMPGTTGISIYDASGRLVATLSDQPNQEGFVWVPDRTGPGVYFAVARSGETRISSKFVVLGI